MSERRKEIQCIRGNQADATIDINQAGWKERCRCGLQKCLCGSIKKWKLHAEQPRQRKTKNLQWLAKAREAKQSLYEPHEQLLACCGGGHHIATDITSILSANVLFIAMFSITLLYYQDCWKWYPILFVWMMITVINDVIYLFIYLLKFSINSYLNDFQFTFRSINLQGTNIVSSIMLTVLTNVSIAFNMLWLENSWSSWRAIRRKQFLKWNKKIKICTTP